MKAGTRVRHNRTGKLGTTTSDARVSVDGKVRILVQWDGTSRAPMRNLVSMLTTV